MKEKGRRRVRLENAYAYTPSFEGPIEGFVVNTIKRNYWRVSTAMGRDDLMQEAWVLFLRLRERYPHVDNARWFMALFKASWLNRIEDFARINTRLSSVPECRTESSEAHNAGYLLSLVGEAPEEVATILRLLALCPSEILDAAAHAWRERGRRSIDGAAFLSELLGEGYDSLDAVALVRDYLS